eukprot:3811966-Pyramimonas_sp.AAC.1
MGSGDFVNRLEAVVEPFWEALGLRRVDLGGFLGRCGPRGSPEGECAENARFPKIMGRFLILEGLRGAPR